MIDASPSVGEDWSHHLVFEDALATGEYALIVATAARLLLAAGDAGTDLGEALERLRLSLPVVGDARPYIASQEWTFARTMPDRPHWYVLLRRSTDWAEHLRMLLWLRSGELEMFHGHPYRYRTVDDFRYWAMGPNDTIINRRRATEDPKP